MNRRSLSRTPMAMLLLGIVLGPTNAEDDEAAWTRMLETLEALWSGTLDERIQVALETEDRFEPFFDEPETRLEELARIADSLHALMTAERDEWVLDRLAFGLAEEWSESLTPLFLEALDHPSPNLRHRAIGHFIEVEAPEALPQLRRLWRREKRPWILVDLIEALENHDSETLGQESLKLIESEDLDLARAAIAAVARLHPPEAVPALARRATRGPSHVRIAALQALGSFSDSAEAGQAVLRATHSVDHEIKLEAVRLLSGFTDDDAAISRLLELAAEPEAAPELRATLFCALPDRADIRGLRLDLLEDLELEAAGHFLFTSCISSLGPPRVLVVAPTGIGSTRCWEGPRIAGDPIERPRMPAGTEVEIVDHFEDPSGDLWVQVEDDDGLECWMAREELVEGTDEERSRIDPDSGFHREFDALGAEADSDGVARLLDARLLSVIEPGDAVVGFALEIDPDDRTQVELLLEAFEPDASLVSEAVVELLSLVAPRWVGDPDLGAGIAEATGVRPSAPAAPAAP